MIDLPPWLRVVALYTIGSAFVGLASLVLVVLAIPESVRTFSLPAGAVFFVWAVWAGTRTLQHRRDGVRALYLVQLAQIVAFSHDWRVLARVGLVGQLLLASVGFRLEGGWQGQFDLTHAQDGALRAAGLSLMLGAGIGSSEEFERATWTVGINLVALLVALQMWRYMKTATFASAERESAHETDMVLDVRVPYAG